MNHYVYEITNNINGKKYIGKRSCGCTIAKDLYMGSGILIKKALIKYGVENFTKNILLECISEDEAYKKEFEAIEGVKAYNNSMYYNLRGGGKGGVCVEFLSNETRKRIRESHWSKRGYTSYMKGKHHSEKTKLRIIMAKEGTNAGINNPFYGKCQTIEVKKAMSESHKCIPTNKHPMYGKHHSDETKKIMSELKKGKHLYIEHNLNVAKARMISVICLNNGETFKSMKDACDYVGLSTATHITACCKYKLKSAGKINGKPAKWMYLEEYNKQQLALTI